MCGCMPSFSSSRHGRVSRLVAEQQGHAIGLSACKFHVGVNVGSDGCLSGIFEYSGSNMRGANGMVVTCRCIRVLQMLTLAGAACQLDIPTRPKQKESLRLMKHAWTSHQLVSEVAAILLEEVLMYDVLWVTPQDSPLHDFRAIAMGSADANFEVWQGGKAEQIQRWVQADRAIVAAHHHVSGFSGIFTLKHTIDRFPQAEFYQNLQSPELHWLHVGLAAMVGESAADPAQLCSRAEWQCKNFTWQSPSCRHDPTHCVGQVLHEYSHYTQGILEQQIANNNLSLSVAYLTSTSKEAQIWEAYASRRDLLFQHYYPSAGVEGVPASNLVPVQFPPAKYGCNTTHLGNCFGRLLWLMARRVPNSFGLPTELREFFKPCMEA